MKINKEWIALAIVAGMPFFLGPYWQGIFVLAHLNLMVVFGLYLLMRLAGQISLGQAGFLALGAYASSLLQMKIGLSLHVAIICSLVLSILVSGLLGWACLRLKGHYLAMGTLAFGLSIYYFAKGTGWMGGNDGYGGIPLFQFGSMDFSLEHHWLILCLVLNLFIYLCLAKMQKSQWGRVYQLIKENESTASQMGHNVVLYKIIAFMIAGLLASFSGVLHAHYLSYVGPDDFYVDKSILYLVFLMIASNGKLWTVFLSTLALSVLPELLGDLEDHEVLFFGLILVIALLRSQWVSYFHART